MTIAALRRLLDEIDTQGGPDAARANRLTLEGTAVIEQPQPTQPAPTPEAVPVGRLLAWADDHNDLAVRDQAARARAALTGLRRRFAADVELNSIATERENLTRRLGELNAREAELAPAKPKKRRQQVRDYDTRTVRTWAAENAIDCPRVGQIPRRVLDAWRASLSEATQ
ncbi:hypothetical protein ACFV0R_18985 [Streptomyces sp. NPDC059578]|uniref:hypothetical protein n=1 Tax=Streptomyces sp. NPDC059578 TaxID=3346874 RepID=UPI003680426F